MWENLIQKVSLIFVTIIHEMEGSGKPGNTRVSAGRFDLHSHAYCRIGCIPRRTSRSHLLSQTCFSSYMGGFLSWEMPSILPQYRGGLYCLLNDPGVAQPFQVNLAAQYHVCAIIKHVKPTDGPDYMNREQKGLKRGFSGIEFPTQHLN